MQKKGEQNVRRPIPLYDVVDPRLATLGMSGTFVPLTENKSFGDRLPTLVYCY